MDIFIGGRVDDNVIFRNYQFINVVIVKIKKVELAQVGQSFKYNSKFKSDCITFIKSVMMQICV